jgi:hypothetical protein
MVLIIQRLMNFYTTLNHEGSFFQEAYREKDNQSLQVRLFFDMNGSGLKDEATFNYDPVRPADPRQPHQHDLVNDR